MRQAGVLAAAGLYALDHHVERLPEDHANARAIGERLAAVDGVQLDLDRLETNIVVFRLADGAPDAATVVARARERGVLVMAFAARTVRAVTHLDVTAEDCAAAAERARGLRSRRTSRGGARPARSRPGGRRRRRRARGRCRP